MRLNGKLFNMKKLITILLLFVSTTTFAQWSNYQLYQHNNSEIRLKPTYNATRISAFIDSLNASKVSILAPRLLTTSTLGYVWTSSGTTGFGSWQAQSSGGTWGSITGTLSSQTDLQTALNLKSNIASPTFTGTVTVPSGAVLATPTSLTLTNATGLPEGGLSTTDITTNNVTTSKHGFFPKLSTAPFDQYRINSGGTAIESYAPLLNPATTNGDLTYYNGTTYDRLGIGTSGQFLKVSGGLPAWVTQGTLAVADGGTGQTTANAALNALLPSQSGNNGKVLITDATNSSWQTLAGAGIAVTGATTLTGAITVTGSTSNTNTWAFPSLGTTTTIGAGILYTNATAATSGNQQISPNIALRGNVYQTTAAASQTVEYGIDVLPVQGSSTARQAVLRIRPNINSGGYTTDYAFSSGGAFVGYGTSPLFSVFSSYVSSSNYTGLHVGHGYRGIPGASIIYEGVGAGVSTSTLNIGNVGDGTITFVSNNTNTWTMGASGTTHALFPGTDNTRDLGLVGNRVRTIYGGGGVMFGYVAKTGTYTATSNDYTINCTSGTFTVTLPTAVSKAGQIYVVTNSGAGTITIATTSSQTFANVTATPTTLTMATVGSRTVQSDGANWLLLSSL